MKRTVEETERRRTWSGEEYPMDMNTWVVKRKRKRNER